MCLGRDRGAGKWMKRWGGRGRAEELEYLCSLGGEKRYGGEAMGGCPARKRVPRRGGCGFLGGTCQFTFLLPVLTLPTLTGRQNFVQRMFFFFKSWTGDSLFPNHGVFLEMGVLPFPFLLLIAPRRLEVLFVFYRKGTRAFHVNQCVIRWLKFACLLREILLKLSVLTCRTVFSTYFWMTV